MVAFGLVDGQIRRKLEAMEGLCLEHQEKLVKGQASGGQSGVDFRR